MKILVTFIFLFIGLVFAELSDDYLNSNINDANENISGSNLWPDEQQDIYLNNFNANDFDQLPFNNENENLIKFDETNLQVTDDDFSAFDYRQTFSDQFQNQQQKMPSNEEVSSESKNFFPEYFDLNQEWSDIFDSEPEFEAKHNDNIDNIDLFQTPSSLSHDQSFGADYSLNSFSNLNFFNGNDDKIIENRLEPIVLDFVDQIQPSINLFENNIAPITTQNINPTNKWIFTFKTEESTQAVTTTDNKYSTLLNALTQSSYFNSSTPLINSSFTPDVIKASTSVEKFMNYSSMTNLTTTTPFLINQTIFNDKNATSSSLRLFKPNRTDDLRKGMSFENSPKLDDMYDAETLPNLDHSNLPKSNSMHFVEKRIHSSEIFPIGR
jgi:hypothetical protein